MADGAAAPTSVQKAGTGPDPLIGRVINDRFRVVALIARGGMGKVYRAEQAPLGRVCALKVLNPNYAGDSDPEFHKRFFLEASIASKLTHPNSVTIFDYGRTEDDVYYMAMEYLEGRTLHRTIREEGPFAEERAAHIARQICRALREAHSLGVIHRDLKPANIYLVEHGDEADFVKVLDFGLVKRFEGEQQEELTQAGLFMGSPKYMSPEQIRGDRVDARTDIYSLGVVIYEMLTGKVPFDRANSVNILMAHVNEPPPPLQDTNPDSHVSPAIEDVVFRCLAKDPDIRFSSMDEMLASLKQAGSGALTGTMMGVAATGEFAAAGPYLGGSGANPRSTPSGSTPMLLSSGVASGSGSNPQIDTSMLDGGERKNNSGLIIGIAAVAACLAMAAFFFAGRSSKTNNDINKSLANATTAHPTTTTPISSTTTSSSAATPPSADVPNKPVTVEIEIDTDPDGASVHWKSRDGERLCEKTPCKITFKGKDAEGDIEQKIYVEKKGFSTTSKTFKVNSTNKINIKLASRGGGGVVAPPPTATKGGWKDVPY
jgi:eukaryotic-like serine/threonine-protein kinase